MEYTYSENAHKLVSSAIRDILKMAQRPGVISLSAGNPAPAAFPKEAIAKIVNDIFATDPVKALQYSTTDGEASFLKYLKEYESEKHQLFSGNDSIMITGGAQQVMLLTARILCNPDEVILVEEPSFVGSLNSFRSIGAKLVGVPMEDDGLNLEILEQKAKELSPKLLYVIPNFQNPTGITTSLEKRKAIYEIAKKYNIIIIEDNPYGELRYEGEHIPAIKSFDTEGIVMYAGSFSKVISPGLRVGYAIGPNDIIRKMVVAKQADDVHTSILSQLICHKVMIETDYEAYLDGLRALYAKKLNLCLELFEKHLAPYGVKKSPVYGGLFVWCSLPENIDMNEFCEKALTEFDVAVVPGGAFFCTPANVTNTFRINFSTPSDDQMKEGFARLEKPLKSFI